MPFYKANQEYNASTTADYTHGDATIAVNSLPANFPTIITLARGTAKETRFTVTGGGSGLLTGVTRLDGASENISAGVSVECMFDADYINQLESAIYVQSSLKNLVYAADGGSNDTYAITLAVAPDSYTDILGLPIAFKANTVNTGPATLNVNSLGAKTIKKYGDEDLEDGDIQAGQIVLVTYDGTNFQMQGDIPISRAKRVTSTASSATPTPNADTTDVYQVTALAEAATFGAPTGTPTAGQGLIIRIKDNGTARALSWNAIYRPVGVALPSTTVLSKTLYIGMIYNVTDTKWDVIAVAQEA